MYDDPVSRALAVIRQHYDDGGDVEPLMSRVIEDIGDRAIKDKRVLEPEAVLKPGPEQSVWDKISSRLMGDRPSPERRRFVEGMGNIADVAHMGAYRPRKKNTSRAKLLRQRPKKQCLKQLQPYHRHQN